LSIKYDENKIEALPEFPWVTTISCDAGGLVVVG